MSTQLLLTQAAGSGGGAAGFIMLVPYLLIFVVFWFFLIRPQQVRMKEHRAKIASVKPRDQVVTGGGIVGKVTRVDDDFADVEIAQGVKIKIVKSTISLARALGLRVVAEGIEDQETTDALRALGCPIGQGYHLGRPVPAAAIDDLLAATKAATASGL